MGGLLGIPAPCPRTICGEKHHLPGCFGWRQVAALWALSQRWGEVAPSVSHLVAPTPRPWPLSAPPFPSAPSEFTIHRHLSYLFYGRKVYLVWFSVSSACQGSVLSQSPSEPFLIVPWWSETVRLNCMKLTILWVRNGWVSAISCGST